MILKPKIPADNLSLGKVRKSTENNRIMAITTDIPSVYVVAGKHLTYIVLFYPDNILWRCYTLYLISYTWYHFTAEEAWVWDVEKPVQGHEVSISRAQRPEVFDKWSFWSHTFLLLISLLQHGSWDHFLSPATIAESSDFSNFRTPKPLLQWPFINNMIHL